jgi:hypothetical protein
MAGQTAAEGEGLLRLPQRLPECDAVSIYGPKPKLPETPRLVARFREGFGPTSNDLLIVLVDAIDVDVGEVRVVAEVRHGQGLRAFSEHELEAVLGQERPSSGVYGIAAKPEDVGVVLRGCPQVADGEYAAGTDDASHKVISSEGSWGASRHRR